MAKAKDKSEKPTVTRIKAKDSKKTTAPKQAKTVKPAKVTVNGDQGEPKKNFFKKFFGYFSGAWAELRQVHWPNRRATWSMTAALLLFTGLFAGFILLIDLLWEYLFKLLIG